MSTSPTQLGLWNVASVTEQEAIISTEIRRAIRTLPSATLIGHRTGDTWWQPTRACLELVAVTAGFVGIDCIGELELNSRTGAPGFLHAYMSEERWTPTTAIETRSLKITALRQTADPRLAPRRLGSRREAGSWRPGLRLAVHQRRARHRLDPWPAGAAVRRTCHIKRNGRARPGRPLGSSRTRVGRVESG